MSRKSSEFRATNVERSTPLEDVSILQDKSRIRHVHIAGKRMAIPERGYDPYEVTDIAWTNWNDLYTQARVAELGIRPAKCIGTGTKTPGE